ncbi:MAG: two-component regulator propeller domain-containing protein [Spirosomataceae bacterium]
MSLYLLYSMPSGCSVSWSQARRRLCLWLIGVLGWSMSLHAQELPIRNYSTRDGLLSNTVYIVFQDKAGYLWIATDAGISRFDGRHFTNFERSSDNTPLGIQLSMVQTADGHIWMGGNGNGLFEFDGQQFVHYDVGKTPGSNLVTALCEMSPSTLFIGTEKGVFVRKGGTIVPIREDIKMMRSFKFTPSGDVIKISPNQVKLIANGQLYQLDLQTKELSVAFSPPRPNDHFDWATQLRNGKLLVGCANQHRLYLIDGKDVLQTIDLGQLVPNYAIEDAQGFWWIATKQGFLKMNSRSIPESSSFSTHHGLPFASGSTIFVDREQNLWFGSYGKGIYKVEETETIRFPYPFAAGLADTDADGRLWYTSPDGLHVIEQQTGGTFAEGKVFSFDANYTKTMGAIKAVATNQLWLGTDDGHLANMGVTPQKSGFLLRFKREIGPRTGWPKLKTNWIFVDSKGRLWCSDADKPILYVVDITLPQPRLIKKLSFDPGKRLSNGRVVFEDNQGNFWFAHERKPVVTFDKHLQPVALTNTIPASNENEVSSVLQDQEGAMWFGTDNGGLIRITKEGKLRQLRTSDGLLSNHITRIVEGPDHTIWAGTWQGVAFIHYQGDSLQFSENHELPEGPTWSLGVLRDGFGWLATNYEVVIHKKRTQKPIFKPTLLLSNLLVNGQPYPQKHDLLTLESDENNLVFELSTIYFQSHGSVRFQWKLEGSSFNHWSVPSLSESVNLAGLESGKYVFWAKAITSDGVESVKPVRFAFEIVPPFWSRWWFVLGCFVLIASVIAIVVQVRIRRLLEIERLRARIAADLHDDIGSGLTRIALTSELLLRQANKAIDPTSLLQRIGNTSRELIEAMSDIVWAIDPQNDSLEKVADRIHIFANDLCEAKGITCVFGSDCLEPQRKLGSDIVSSMVLIAKEALSNSVRHAQCQRLSIQLACVSRQVSLQITDDGIGFEQDKLLRINGLVNMQRRAEKANATFAIQSGVGKGTSIQVVFTIP